MADRIDRGAGGADPSGIHGRPTERLTTGRTGAQAVGRAEPGAGMIRAAALVLGLLIIGNVAAARLGLPVPGSALGLSALAALFALRGEPDPGTAELFDFAQPYFPLFFVPAAVGVIASLDLLASAWLHVLVAIALGTAATLVVTGLVCDTLFRRRVRQGRA